MALTATFAADFSRFERSIQSATVKLQTFDKATKNAVRDLRRDVETFSGQKVLVEATRMTEAVTRLGGVSKLTQSEITRLSGTLNEAANKAARMGQALPPAVAKMRAEVENLPKSTSAAASGFSTFAREMLPVATAAGAITMAMRGVVDIVRQGGQLAAVGEGFRAMAGGSDRAAQMLDQMRAGARGLVTDLNLMQAANKAMLLGVSTSAEELGQLARTAQVLGRAMGQDATKSLDDLITALGRSSPLILDNLGLTVKVGEANEKYAAQIGKVVDQLTEEEKKQAFMNAALEAAQKRLEQIGEPTLTLTDRFDQLKTSVLNAAGAYGELIVKSEGLNKFFQDFVDALQIGLPRALIEADIALLEFAVSIGKVSQYYPTFRNLFGQTSKDVAQFEADLQRARDTLEAFDQAGVKISRRPRPSAGDSGSGTKQARDYAQALADVRAKVQALDPAMRVQLDAAIKLGVKTEELTAQFGLTEEELRIYSQVVQEVAQQKKELEKQANAAAEAQKKFLASIKALNDVTGPLKANLQDAGETIRNLWSQSIADAGDEQARLNQELEDWANRNGAVYRSVEQVSSATEKAARETKKWRDQLRDLSNALSNLAHVSGGSFGDAVRWISTTISAMDTAGVAAEGMRDGWRELVATSGSVADGLAQIATNALAAAAAFEQVTGSGNTFQRTIGGAAVGAQIGSIFGPIGAGIGAGVGGAIGFFRGIFGVPQEVVKARQELTKFQETLRATLSPEQRRGLADWEQDVVAIRDAFLTVGRSEQEALRYAEMLWDTDNPERSKRAIEEINRVLEESSRRFNKFNQDLSGLLAQADQLGIRLPQALLDSLESLRIMGRLTEDNAAALSRLAGAAEVDWRKMQSAAEKYGIDVESLGQTFRQLRFTDAAKEIINDFDLLARGGADVGTVLFGMRDEISELVQSAKKFGLEIPGNMKPWIFELQRAGLLVDAQGNKIEDLGDIKFSDPIKTEFEKITDAINELIKTLNRLSNAISGLPSPNIDVPDPGSVDGRDRSDSAPALSRGGIVGRNGVHYFAGGGFVPRGSDTVPAMLTPGEMVFSRADTKRFLRFIRDGGTPTVSTPVNVQVNGKTLLSFVLEQTGRMAKARGV